MILLMGNESDPQIIAIADALTRQGNPFLIFDSGLYPAQHKLSYRPHDNSMQLQIGEHYLAQSDVHSLYWRTLSPPYEKQDNPIALRDSASLLRSFLHLLGHKSKNSADAVHFHQEKPRQLAQIAQSGIVIPETYVGNDPRAVRSFCAKHSAVIFKPVTGGDYAQIVNQAHLTDEHLNSSLNQSPVTLQAYVEGTNIRSYVIGDAIFSAEIRSSAKDFRTDEDAELIPITLPAEIMQQAKIICRTLGLEWSGIDWRRTPDNKYIFLEANPSPMFANFEKRTRLPITEHLAQLLAA
jgi:glutathione synthase/RimK-type ligase-like ATP-grasp enzyme